MKEIIAKMDTSDWLSLIAISVSVISAVVALLSWWAAKVANRLAMHGDRREIFIAFDDLASHMDQHGVSAELSEIGKFNSFRRKAVICYKSDTVTKLNDYYELCVAMHKSNDSDEAHLLEKEKKLVKSLRKELESYFSNAIKA